MRTLIILSFLPLTACVAPMPKGDFLQLNAVTAKGKELPVAMGTEISNVKEKFCASDEQDMMKRVGFVDALVDRALNKDANASYIANANFRYVDDVCVELTGKLMSTNGDVVADLNDEAATVTNRSPAAQIPYLEIADVQGAVVSIGGAGAKSVRVNSTYAVMDPQGAKRGMLKITNVGPEYSTGEIVEGKAFWGWSLGRGR